MTTPWDRVADSWDAEYLGGRYAHDRPVAFVETISLAARAHRCADRRGLSIGCGNGRNDVPLVVRGLDLVGLDVSRTAIAHLRSGLQHSQTDSSTATWARFPGDRGSRP